jgi:hypothetical protein
VEKIRRIRRSPHGRARPGRGDAGYAAVLNEAPLVGLRADGANYARRSHLCRESVMLRKPLSFLLMLVPGLSVTLVAGAAASYFAQEPPTIPGAPYSAVATTQSTTVFSDGTHIVRGNSVRFFRDGQGRTRIERGVAADGQVLPGESNPTITINDPVSGQRYRLFPEKKLVLAFKLPAHSATSQDTVPASELDTPFALLGFGMGIGAGAATETSTAATSLGEKVISGLTTRGTRLVRTIPSDVLGNDRPITSTRDEWLSPDLGVVVQITEKSSIGGEVTLNLSQVVRGEPDSTLFTPPANYVLRQSSVPGLAVQTVSGTVASGTAVRNP